MLRTERQVLVPPLDGRVYKSGRRPVSRKSGVSKPANGSGSPSVFVTAFEKSMARSLSFILVPKSSTSSSTACEVKVLVATGGRRGRRSARVSTRSGGGGGTAPALLCQPHAGQLQRTVRVGRMRLLEVGQDVWAVPARDNERIGRGSAAKGGVDREGDDDKRDEDLSLEIRSGLGLRRAASRRLEGGGWGGHGC